MNNNFVIFLILGILTLIGTVFLIAGILILNSLKKKMINCTSKTYGKVINIVKHRIPDSDFDHSGNMESYFPVFEYNIRNLSLTKEYTYGNSHPKYEIGQTVEICYNPENYNEYYVEGDKLPKKLAVIFNVIGIILISIALLSLILILNFTPNLI